MSKEFIASMSEKGIKHEFIVPYTPQQNGVAQRNNRSLMETTCCMLKRVRFTY